MKSAALIIIGDEILTGKVKDDNSFVFAQTMFSQGVRVSRIKVIPDDIDDIAQSVAHYSSRFDYVCTSGGVGPTHDDKTFAGVAQGLSLPLQEHSAALDYFKNAQIQAGRGETVTETQRKMLRFPTPCQVFFVQPLWLPLVCAGNVFIFPGVPYLFEKLMSHCAHLFKGGKFFREIIYTDRSENTIATDLSHLQDEYPSLNIGSYPQMPGKSFNVMVTIEGEEQSLVALACERLLPLIDGRKL